MGRARSDGLTTFPLVQRKRLVGLSFAAMRSVRRGTGSDVAGSRPYRPGDSVKTIDWNASARLSLARGGDEFVVRETYAEEAPRVVVLADRRPSMSLYPAPWLAKPDALAVALRLISDSAVAARSFLGYLDHGDGARELWQPPRGQHALELGERPFGAPEDAVERGLRFLHDQRSDLPSGTFVFVCSDFLVPPPRDAWLRALERGWDVVPVVLQDPTWERSFPEIGGVVVPLADPATGDTHLVRLTEAEAAAHRAENERRWEETLRGLRSLALEPVVLESADAREALEAFLGWAERRLWTRGRS